MKKFMVLVLAAALVLPLVGCKEKSPVEKAGAAVEEAAKKTADAAQDAAKEVKEAAK